MRVHPDGDHRVVLRLLGEREAPDDTPTCSPTDGSRLCRVRRGRTPVESTHPGMASPLNTNRRQAVHESARPASCGTLRAPRAPNRCTPYKSAVQSSLPSVSPSAREKARCSRQRWRGLMITCRIIPRGPSEESWTRLVSVDDGVPLGQALVCWGQALEARSVVLPLTVRDGVKPGC